MRPEFWHGKRVLITGHTGFKGSWLCLLLDRLGAQVTGYSLDPPTTPNLFDQAGIGQRVDTVNGDIRDLEHLSAIIADATPEVIIHLAAQSVVRESYIDPVETYSTNVTGTACLLQAVRSLNACTVVNVTSDKCYENREWIWPYRESDRLGGHDPYSNSKACAEFVTQSFRDSFFPLETAAKHRIGLATGRAGNVIGGGDWTKDQLVPDIVRAFSAGESVLIRRPDAVRPWQHVLDCLAGYLALAERLYADPVKFSGAWNFGPNSSDIKPVSWIADYFAENWGNSAWRRDVNQHPHEARLLHLDSTKALSILGWSPRLRLSKALDWTLEWYKSTMNGSKPNELCIEQIDAYTAL